MITLRELINPSTMAVICGAIKKGAVSGALKNSRTFIDS
jgi:hypothetical protein